MSGLGVLYKRPAEFPAYALLQRYESFGFEELDLLRPPGRFWVNSDSAPPGVERHVDAQRVNVVPTPAELLARTSGESWLTMTRRSLARLFAWFLIAEDPQRRLDVQPIVTLAHQASVVQHILKQPSLRRVLLADEVGLGKTIEAGLLIKEVLAQNQGARVLYLAPARLVRNVRGELHRLGLTFRAWVATADRDATLKDAHVIASIHRACHKGRIDEVVKAPPWDMIIVDECHHLSDWAPGGGSPVAQYKLVARLADRLGDNGRLILMSGTPHQGHADRFRNVLRLLQSKEEDEAELAGRVIYRTKEDVKDWDEQPLFPGRIVNPPLVIDLGPDYRAWLADIHDFFEPERRAGKDRSAQRRAAGWRAGQALQWASSSVQAGLGYLVRQAIRVGCKLGSLAGLDEALAALRPYRLGAPKEPIAKLFERMAREIQRQLDDADMEDIEEVEEDGQWRPNMGQLSKLLQAGVRLLGTSGDAKWKFLYDRVLKPAAGEKVVLFAQPIETVTTVATWLECMLRQRPALIIGGQSEEERDEQVRRFWDPSGPQFLVSSRAGGEGLNLQIARRLVHLDVPWNPMELEQRVGRVHRFLSKRTILVDTLVVKDSREVDTYTCAREKLKTIASTLVPEDRFDALFGRVMSLVPPEDLQDILGQGPAGPLSVGERQKIAELVTRGFDEWKRFHQTYAQQRRQIHALDPGQATWSDLASFAQAHLNATSADGFSVLRFLAQNDEIVAEQRDAKVLAIDGRFWACGDYGGMPVTRDDGVRAERLGLNSDTIARELRALGLPEVPTGAAHVRWPEGEPRPHEGPFGVIVVARQSVRWEQGYTEHAVALHCFTVDTGGRTTPVEGRAKGAIVRALLRAVVRRDPEDAPELVAALQRAEAATVRDLCQRTGDDREARIVHAVTPLLAAVIGGGKGVPAR